MKRAVFWTFLLLLSFGSIASEGKRSTKLVAAVGCSAPGGNTATVFTNFDEPMVNARKDVAFLADTDEGSGVNAGTGVYLWRNGNLSKVAASGDVVSGVTLSTDFDGPAINRDATVAFVNRSTVNGVYRKLLGQPVELLVKTGDAVPGGGTFDDFDDISLNDPGAIAFLASYTDGGTGHGGVFRWSNGTVTAIVRDGDALPVGGTMAATFAQRIDGPWMNNRGDVAFQPEEITGASARNESVFIRKNGSSSIRSLLLIGTNTRWGTIDRIGLGRPGINNEEAGMKLSFGPLDTSPAILVTKELESGSALKRCVRTSDTTTVAKVSSEKEGKRYVFEGFQDPAINQDGTLAFGATIIPTNSTTETDAIFTCHEGEVRLIATEGGPRPTTSGGTFLSLEEASTGGKSDTPPVTFLEETGAVGAVAVWVSGGGD